MLLDLGIQAAQMYCNQRPHASNPGDVLAHQIIPSYIYSMTVAQLDGVPAMNETQVYALGLPS